MRQRRVVETFVGLFMLLAIAGLIFLAFKVSGLTESNFSKGYMLTASFENIGSLKVRAPVKIGGVVIGKVKSIDLNPGTYQADVTMLIYNEYKIPEDSTANIYTEGLLGSNYLNFSPGYSSTYLKPDSKVQQTTSALILEKLIGQFLFNVQK